MKKIELVSLEAVHTHTHTHNGNLIEFSRAAKNATLKIDVYKTDQLII